jgi:RND family efflux transporter MFP subunit
VDDAATVILDALPARKFRGNIVTIFPQGDDQSRTFPVEVTVPNSDGVIRAGMLCRVDLGVGEPRMALMVHKDALVLGGPTPAVYKVNDKRAHIVNVEILGYQGERVEIRGELSPGDSVVVRGNERIRDGQQVMVLSDPSNSSSSESSGQRKKQ